MAQRIDGTNPPKIINSQDNNFWGTGTVKKVIGIAIAALIAAAAVQYGGFQKPCVPILEAAPSYLTPYHLNQCAPSLSDPIIQFSPYLASTFQPGWLTVEGRACQIAAQLPTIETCESTSKFIEDEVQAQSPQDYQAMMASKKDGFLIKAENSGSVNVYLLGLNPEKLNNYKKALNYIETHVLKHPDFFNLSPQEIVNALKKTNGLVQNNHGYFRQEYAVVTENKIPKTKKGFQKALLENGGSQQDLKVLNQYFARAGKMTDQERSVLNKFGFVAVAPEDIEAELLNLAVQFKEISQCVVTRRLDPVAGAAFVHQEIGRIHPFADGNGKVARAWMNAVLQLGGIKGLVFPDEDQYIEAVKADQKTPGAFTSYLFKIIEWNRTQKNLH